MYMYVSFACMNCACVHFVSVSDVYTYASMSSPCACTHVHVHAYMHVRVCDVHVQEYAHK